MFRHITHQVRTMATKPSDFPRGCRNIGSNLPFNVFKKNQLTVKFILFFCSAFYIPFIALNFQLKKLNQNNVENVEKTKNPKIYKFIPEEESKKTNELYV